MNKSSPLGQAGHQRGNQISLDAGIDAVFMLAWMADGMEMPNGAIPRQYCFGVGHTKIWLRMKAGETPLDIDDYKKPGITMSGST